MQVSHPKIHHVLVYIVMLDKTMSVRVLYSRRQAWCETAYL